MEGLKHGINLVSMLAQENATLVSVNIDSHEERDVNGYTVQTLFLIYEKPNQEEIKVAVNLTKWTALGRKKDQVPVDNTNLSITNLGESYPTQATIDNLMVPYNGIGPELHNHMSVIADGSRAERLYDDMNRTHPKTGQEFMDAIGAGEVTQYFNHLKPETLIPNRQIRSNMARF